MGREVMELNHDVVCSIISGYNINVQKKKKKNGCHQNELLICLSSWGDQMSDWFWFRLSLPVPGLKPDRFGCQAVSHCRKPMQGPCVLAFGWASATASGALLACSFWPNFFHSPSLSFFLFRQMSDFIKGSKQTSLPQSLHLHGQPKRKVVNPNIVIFMD